MYLTADTINGVQVIESLDFLDDEIRENLIYIDTMSDFYQELDTLHNDAIIAVKLSEDIIFFDRLLKVYGIQDGYTKYRYAILRL